MLLLVHLVLSGVDMARVLLIVALLVVVATLATYSDDGVPGRRLPPPPAVIVLVPATVAVTYMHSLRAGDSRCTRNVLCAVCQVVML